MKYKITSPIQKNLTIDLPTSKSISHRAMILAALNDSETIVNNVLDAEDTDLTREALRVMGTNISQKENLFVFNDGFGNSDGGEIFLGNSGSSMRFLLPLGSMTNGKISFDGTPRLRQRPAIDLLNALDQLGANFNSNNGFLPVEFSPSQLRGGKIEFGKLPSSQVVSGLMMATSKMDSDIELILPDDMPSVPYINITYEMMKHFGYNVEWNGNKIYCSSKKRMSLNEFTVEKDMSAASYWVAFSLINDIPVLLKDVSRSSLQGDEFIFDVAEMAGGKIEQTTDGILISQKISKSFSVDCFNTPDLVPTIAVLAMFAPSECKIANIEILRVKECDRIEAIQSNLNLIGGKSDYTDDILSIYPQEKYNGGIINVFDDHRIAMSFAIAGTKVDDIIIQNPNCVKKSYPKFWNDFIWFDTDRIATN